MTKKILLITVVLVCSGTLSKGQINESDTVKFQMRATLTGNMQRGNVKVTTTKSKLDILYAPISSWVFKTQNNSLYQAFAAKADNDIYSRNYLYYKPANKYYPYAIAYVSTNFRRKIDSRFFAGAGVTWQIINQPKNVLKFSSNVVHEITKFDGSIFNYNEFNGEEKVKLWRGTLFLSGLHTLFEKHIRLYYDAYWQPSFSNGNDYRYEYEIGLDFPVWKGLSVNCLYNFRHEHLVIAKIKQDDAILTFGLAYNLKQK